MANRRGTATDESHREGVAGTREIPKIEKLSPEQLSSMDINWKGEQRGTVIEKYIQALQDFKPGDVGVMDTEGDKSFSVKVRLSRAASKLGFALIYEDQPRDDKVVFKVKSAPTSRSTTTGNSKRQSS